MIFRLTNVSSKMKKCEIRCPESRKKLTTQCKFCLIRIVMYVDTKRLGGTSP